MPISLKKPYKIIYIRLKRYKEHYRIPASRCLVIPTKKRDQEVLCNVHWEDDERFYAMHDIMFEGENLEPLHAVWDVNLIDLWKHFYPTIGKSSLPDVEF